MAISSLTSAYSASSGLNSLVAQFMALEKKPLYELQSQRTKLYSKIDLYTDLDSKISDLLTSARDLASTENSSIYNARTSSTSESKEVTATANSNAATGTYQMRVLQLAAGSSVQSSGGLITKAAVISSSKVAPGSGTIDVSESFADAGFGTTPTGTVTINGWTSSDMSNYSSIQDFMDDVNSNTTANIYYDSAEDKFYLEDTTNGSLTFTESEAAGGSGFFTQVKMRNDAGTYDSTTDATGIQTDVLLSEANFDTAVSGSGSFKINGIEISWDASTDTLDGIINAINNSDANVTAYYDTSLDKVVINSKGTGSSDTITLEDVTGSFLMNTLKFSGQTASGGTDAKFTINSTSSGDEITKSSNNFTINGIAYTLKQTNVSAYTDSTYTTITISQDTSAIQTKINDFLEKFNALTSHIKDKSNVDTENYTRGPLAGNTTFTNLRRQLLQLVSEQVTGLTAGDPDYLREIGITVDSNLKVSLSDTATFESAIQSNSKAVENLFNSANGVANKIESLLEPFVESTSSTTGSLIDETKDTLNDQITSLNNRIKSMETRMEIKENQYRQQFFKMQELLNNLVLQGSQITMLTNSALNMMGTSTLF
ncbi:MAG: flagellar filament capping protein FliD [Candidatus Kuenenia sp.]|nr:flagellar filament capping protein FliD [Candidatus Kuenenia hertensis]